MIQIACREPRVVTRDSVQADSGVSMGSTIISFVSATISSTDWRRRRCVCSLGSVISKSLGANSRPTSAAKTFFQNLRQICCANTSLCCCILFRCAERARYSARSTRYRLVPFPEGKPSVSFCIAEPAAASVVGLTWRCGYSKRALTHGNYMLELRARELAVLDKSSLAAAREIGYKLSK